MQINETKTLIKECVLEVLKENLSENFDPLSQGPNPIKDNPYPEWNAHMRTLEEDDKDSAVSYEQGYKDGELRRKSHDKPSEEGMKSKDRSYAVGYYDGYSNRPRVDVDTIRKTIKEDEEEDVETHGRYAQEAGAGQFDPRTFGQLRDAYDPDRTKHDLRLKCIKCGAIETCRCKKPKREMKGICDECAANKKNTPDVSKDPLSDKLAAIDDREAQEKAKQTARAYLAKLRKSGKIIEYSLPQYIQQPVQQRPGTSEMPEEVHEVVVAIIKSCEAQGESPGNHATVDYVSFSNSWLIVGKKVSLIYFEKHRSWVEVKDDDTKSFISFRRALALAKSWLSPVNEYSLPQYDNQPEKPSLIVPEEIKKVVRLIIEICQTQNEDVHRWLEITYNKEKNVWFLKHSEFILAYSKNQDVWFLIYGGSTQAALKPGVEFLYAKAWTTGF
jgi:hypothetical protein